MASCYKRGTVSTGGVQNSWDLHEEVGWSGICTHGAAMEVYSAWGAHAVPASSPCVGMEFPALPWTSRENETCTSGSGAHAHSSASLFIPANSP